MYREICFTTVFAILFSFGTLDAVEDAATGAQEPTSFASRILALTDVVLEQHIDPPARQQMILSGIKSLYLANDRQVPPHLGKRISEMTLHSQFAEYLEDIRNEFKDRKNVEQVLIHGMLRAVPGDSFLIDSKANEVNEQVINNRYVGTGIQLATNREEGLTQITKVFYNGPAWHAGVESMDLILEIDGESTASRGLAEVVEALRGESGSDVEVVVRQPDSKDSRRLTMTRGRVFIPSIEGFREKSDGRWQYRVDSAKNVAFLRVKSIGPSTLHEFRQIAAKLSREDVGGIIIDLREGGGILHDIVMVADSLMDGGTIGHVQSLERTIKHTARSGDLVDGLPIVLLVGKKTSAGNVFLAAALQDNGRAIVVGQSTIGETYVSKFVSVPGMDVQLKLATAIMLRGDKTPILPSRVKQLPNSESSINRKPHRPGFIIPDHVVQFAPNAKTGPKESVDPVLKKAIEVLTADTTKVSISQQGADHGE